MKTWKRNGVTLEIHQQPDGWWQASVTDAAGAVADSAICQRPFVLLRALTRSFRRLAVAAAVLAVVARAGGPKKDGKWTEECSTPPPKEHYQTCPTGQRSVWRCRTPKPGTGVHDPGEWWWEEQCEPTTKGKE